MKRRLCVALGLSAAAALAGCRDKAVPRDPAPDASIASTPPAGGVLDDLLHFTDARIAVSSKVDNPRDFAEHVADGRLDTAWNGRTGDLVGGWIGFRVPAVARVKIIELTAGYVAKSKKGDDLFAMNHRITRVRLSRDGVSLGEHTFDPSSRAFQRMNVDAAGGDFKIEVLAVAPGSRAAWKELVISELRVFGVAGAAKRAAPTIPRVQIGSFDGRPAAAATLTTPTATKRETTEIKVTPGQATPDLECSMWLTPMRARLANMIDAGMTDDQPWLPDDPQCTPHVETVRGDVKLLSISRSDLHHTFQELAIQRGGRVYVLERPFDKNGHYDPHCGGSSGGKLESARIEGAVAIFRVYEWAVTNAWPNVLEDGGLETTPGWTQRSLDEIRCELGDAGASPTCTTKRLAEKREDAEDHSASDHVPPLPW